jgi:hypothetical protein
VVLGLVTWIACTEARRVRVMVRIEESIVAASERASECEYE